MSDKPISDRAVEQMIATAEAIRRDQACAFVECTKKLGRALLAERQACREREAAAGTGGETT